MVRAAAKNFHHVYCFTHAGQYQWLGDNPFKDSAELRQTLAVAAFDLIFNLDSEIAFSMHGRLRKDLRYGENPHQSAVFLSEQNHLRLGEVSFNNIRDAEAALRFVLPFTGPTVAVVKHSTLCGGATSEREDSLDETFNLAWEGDTVSRFGGVLAFNRTPTENIF